jgi:hypothetical protein
VLTRFLTGQSHLSVLRGKETLAAVHHFVKKNLRSYLLPTQSPPLFYKIEQKFPTARSAATPARSSAPLPRATGPTFGRIWSCCAAPRPVLSGEGAASSSGPSGEWRPRLPAQARWVVGARWVRGRGHGDPGVMRSGGGELSWSPGVARWVGGQRRRPRWVAAARWMRAC